MLQDAPDLDALIIPVGGGGLLAGCLVAATALHPGIAVYGAEVENYAAMAQRLAGRSVSVGGATIAEGIAVRDIGEIPFEIVRRRIAGRAGDPGTCHRRSDRPAGRRRQDGGRGRRGRRAGRAAGLSGAVSRQEGRCSPITGGNIDARILSNVLLRDLLRDGRLLRLHLQIPDRPGVLADIAGKIGDSGGNIIEVSHQRLFASSSVQAAELEVMVEARDKLHADAIVEALERTYTVRQV